MEKQASTVNKTAIAAGPGLAVAYYLFKNNSIIPNTTVIIKLIAENAPLLYSTILQHTCSMNLIIM